MANMSKAITLFKLALLLCCLLSDAGRPQPLPLENTSVKTHHVGDGTQQRVDVVDESSCEGVGDEECLMRRTLAAHIDYIYTQKHNKP